MDKLLEEAWFRIHKALTEFSMRVALVDPALSPSLGRSENSAFPLRVYLAFKRASGDGELSIAVDVHAAGEHLKIDSDVCFESGEVVAVGPASDILLNANQSASGGAMEDWLNAFEKFLGDVEATVIEAASRLS